MRYICLQPRSRDYGSPQCRARLYILGVRADLISDASFKCMVNFFVHHLPTYHQQASVVDVLHFVSLLDDAPCLAPLQKDPLGGLRRSHFLETLAAFLKGPQTVWNGLERFVDHSPYAKACVGMLQQQPRAQGPPPLFSRSLPQERRSNSPRSPRKKSRTGNGCWG